MEEDARTHTGMGPLMWPTSLFISPCVAMRLHMREGIGEHSGMGLHDPHGLSISRHTNMRSHMRKGLRKHILIRPHTPTTIRKIGCPNK